jgi:hypothetical protein
MEVTNDFCKEILMKVDSFARHKTGWYRTGYGLPIDKPEFMEKMMEIVKKELKKI